MVEDGHFCGGTLRTHLSSESPTSPNQAPLYNLPRTEHPSFLAFIVVHGPHSLSTQTQPPFTSSLHALKLLLVCSVTPDAPPTSPAEKPPIVIPQYDHFPCTPTPPPSSDTISKTRLLIHSDPPKSSLIPTVNARWVTPDV